MQSIPERFKRFMVVAITATALLLPGFVRAEENKDARQPSVVPAAAGSISGSTPVQAAASAIVNFEELAARERAIETQQTPQIRTWAPNELEEPAEPDAPPAPEPFQSVPILPFIASPGPSTSYQGLDDIAMVDSLYIIIPPDVSGAVGLAKVMEAFNNNYRIRNKTTGATISTVGTATFWAPVVAANERLSLTDPRLAYDPFNNRWLTAMQTVTNGAGKILVGVSQTSDPSGVWNLYSFNSASLLDFPILGFNKNWISVSVNKYTSGGVFSQGINLVVNYPQARVGVGTGTLFTHAANSHFCTAPSVTYSATQDTLFLVTHLSSAGATYSVDRVTGTPAAPVYTSGGTLTRAGGGWVQPSGNLLPQSAPNAGASACGATPCKIETQDSQVRSAVTYRNGFLFYSQTIGLPAGTLTHTAVQWTKLIATSGVLSVGGRIDDATATATNGGKWYAYPHIATNSCGDFIVGYSQFSSAQHPGTGYSIHMGTEAAASLRDPLIYHTGEDYYHKTFSTATGRNRWGDFSTAQVDPSDDRTLWTLQEYAKTRTGTDDGNTGSNSSRWSSWWAGVSTSLSITASAGPNGTISPNGTLTCIANGSNQTYTMTPDPCYHVANVLVDGVSVGAVASYSFTNIIADHTISVTFAVNGPFTINASADPGGSITPNGPTLVACGGSQTYTIEPADKCHFISDVQVDGVSVGALATYTFNSVTANHTIHASFGTFGPFTITATAGPGGSITPNGATLVACGGGQTYAIEPADKCHVIADVVVDGVSVGAQVTWIFSDVQANHTIDATFVLLGPFTLTASAGPGGTITPDGVTPVDCGGSQTYAIEGADKCHSIEDVLVDGVSVGAVGTYTFTDVQANHTIEAQFAAGGPFSIVATAGSGGSITPAGETLVPCGDYQLYTIEPSDKCHFILDVKVDGFSVGPVSTYSFNDVQANHTIEAFFGTFGPFTITASAGAGGSITPSGAVVVACGGSQTFTITPDPGFAIVDVLVDGVSVGAVGTYTFSDVQADHTIDASFADIECPTVAVIAPNGGETLIIGLTTNLQWSASDNVGVTCVDLLLSRTGVSGPYSAIATCIANSGSYSWLVTGPSTTNAILKVVAHDAAGNACEDVSDAPFVIEDVVVPVLLAQFGASPVNDGIELRWSLSDAETFVRQGVERSDAIRGDYAAVDGTLRIEQGSSILLDRTVVPGQTYYYRIFAMTRSGQMMTFEPMAATAGLPINQFTLSPVHPNPTRGAAQISFSVPTETRVHLAVFDVQGREVVKLLDDTFRPGRYSATWSGESETGLAPAGVYFIRLDSPEAKLVQRFVLAR